MRRLILILAFALFPAALFAQVADRDVLLSADGTLYTIDSTSAVDGDSNRYLQLTIANGNKSTVTVVPETDKGGTNWRPTLTYDSDSKTLFLFWIYSPNAMSSELLFASYRDGKFSPSVAFDPQPYHFRYNLRIAVTRKVSTLQTDGSYTDEPALLVHAAWWEMSDVEEARYALFTIKDSQVASFELHDLREFTSTPETPYTVDDNFNAEILRHPAIVPGTDSVDVIFGDMKNTAMNRVTLKPVADTRIHIPVGHHDNHPFPPPEAFSANWTGRITTISSGGNLVMYNTAKNSTGYVMFSNGKWSDVKTLALTPTFNSDAAVAAIGRMVSSQ